jgi:tRNA (mo5U34)-methyltransferase
MAKIDELVALAKAFGDKLASVKAGISPGPFTWYPYQSLSNFPALDQTLTGESRSLLDLAGGKPILDIGCADGDIAFFLESLGCRVDAIDNPITNFNAMCGVKALKDALGSSVGIHAMDLDADFALPANEYGLVLLLGVLYHLKNPFLVLEKLAKHTRYCLLSTALTCTVPAVEADVPNSPLGFLASERELNGDATVYWIFTDAGFRRLLDRTNWEICDYRVLPTGDRWTGLRVFCLAKSKFADRPVNVLYGRGWHAIEEGGWRWTERQFAVRIEGTRKSNASQLRLRLYVPAAVGAITIEAIANGIALAPETYSKPGEYEFVRSLAPFSTATGDIRIDFNLSSALPPDSTDRRERGIIVASITIE